MSEYRCNLVIPGFPKSGTSSLHAYLAQHPSICMSSPKEPHHFSRSDRWEQGAIEHNAIFGQASGSERYFGESSTTYCAWPDAAERTAASLAAPKVIILMRHPIDRTISHYRWMYRLGLESRPLMDALLADGDTFHPDQSISGMFRGYLTFSRYADHVPRWEGLIDAEDLILVRSSDLAQYPDATVARLHRFLGLSDETLTHVERVNQTDDQKPIGRRRWASVRRAVPSPIASALTRIPGLHELWSNAVSIGVREPPPITDADRSWLGDALEPHVRFYEEFSG